MVRLFILTVRGNLREFSIWNIAIYRISLIDWFIDCVKERMGGMRDENFGHGVNIRQFSSGPDHILRKWPFSIDHFAAKSWRKSLPYALQNQSPTLIMCGTDNRHVEQQEEDHFLWKQRLRKALWRDSVFIVLGGGAYVWIMTCRFLIIFGQEDKAASIAIFMYIYCDRRREYQPFSLLPALFVRFSAQFRAKIKLPFGPCFMSKAMSLTPT